MAHKKAGGSKARQGSKTRGRRLGIKVSGGDKVRTGQIILRQRGSQVKPGGGVGMGKDFTLFAKRSGTVRFGHINRSKKKVAVV